MSVSVALKLQIGTTGAVAAKLSAHKTMHEETAMPAAVGHVVGQEVDMLNTLCALPRAGVVGAGVGVFTGGPAWAF